MGVNCEARRLFHSWNRPNGIQLLHQHASFPAGLQGPANAVTLSQDDESASS